MISKQLQEKLDYYEQIYFSLDKPVPFKGKLQIHPILVEDYYNFYACFPCLSMDKNVKTEIDEKGRPIKVANPKGIGQSYMAYLIDMMEDEAQGQLITQQITTLFELVFHIKRGFYCPVCGQEVGYEEALIKLDEYVKEAQDAAKRIYAEQFDDNEKHEVPGELIEKHVPK